MTEEQRAEIERLLPAVHAAFIESGVSASMSPIYLAWADARLLLDLDDVDSLLERLRRHAKKEPNQ